MEQTILQELNKIIDEKRITSVFQPIVSLVDGHVLGYEALSRVSGPTETGLSNPECLFRIAEKSGRLWDLEHVCLLTALSILQERLFPHTDKKLFLNISPNTIDQDPFRNTVTRNLLQKYGIMPDQIVFELTERHSVKDSDRFKATIDYYKSKRVQIAIDDVGAMYSGLNLINAVRPHFIKVDKTLIRNIELGRINFALVKGLVEFCRVSHIDLIAEGVETESELVSLIDLGVPYAQGYLLKRPGRDIEDIENAIKKIIVEKNKIFAASRQENEIVNICTSTATLSKEMRAEAVFEEMKKDPKAFGKCVVENGYVIGVVTKAHLTAQLSGRFGFSLFQSQPISALMDTDFISVDYRTPINEVSQIAMSRPQEKLYDFIVVTKEGKYLGTVTIKDLLQRATEIEVIKAKYANPLTGLPGNLLIEQKMKESLNPEKPIAILYIDINHFKEYNDVYGFENGDRVIELLAGILCAHVPRGQFVGHVGGDDFVVIMQDETLDCFCSDVSSEFRRRVRLYYNLYDRKKGFMVAENRFGHIEKFSLMTISLAGIRLKDHEFTNLIELTEELARLKKKCKQMKSGNHLLIRKSSG